MPQFLNRKRFEFTTYSLLTSIIFPLPASISVPKLSSFVVFRMTRKSLKIPFADGNTTDWNFFRQRNAAFATAKSFSSICGKFLAFGLPHSNSSS